MNQFKHNKKGFTLVELLIYTAVFAIAAGLLTTILITTTRIENTELVSTQVGQELNLILTTVQRLVRDASLIEKVYEGTTETNPCVTFCSLKLRMQDSNLDPTVIRATATAVYLKQGANPETTITTNRVIVNSLNFIKFDIPGGHATIQIDARLTYNSSKPELQISKTLRSAVGRVSAATFDSDLLPNQDNTYSVGQNVGSLRWKNGSFSGDLTVAGNVGVGTTTPTALLTLAGSAPTIQIGGLTGSSSGGILKLGFAAYDIDNLGGRISHLGDTTGLTLDAFGGSSGSGNINFRTGSGNQSQVSTAMTIKYTGNVGIGTAEPKGKLSIGDFSYLDSYSVGVNVTTFAEVTIGGSSLPNDGVYLVQMVTRGTAVDTGAMYLVWYDEGSAAWQTRLVSRVGSGSNHPYVIIDTDGKPKIRTDHASIYNIAVTVTGVSGEPDILPQIAGGNYMWQRDGNKLYYTEGYVLVPNRPAFSVSRSTYWAGLGVITGWDVTGVNNGNHFNTTTGVFTAPVEGLYQFCFGGLEYPSAGRSYADIRVNGVTVPGGRAYANAGVEYDGVYKCVIVNLNVNDTVHVYNNDAAQGWHLNPYISFSGHLL